MSKLGLKSERSLSSLPEELSLGRAGQITAETRLPKGYRWGPFPVEQVQLVGPDGSLDLVDIRISQRLSTGSTTTEKDLTSAENFRMVLEKDRWVRNLGHMQNSSDDEDSSAPVNTHLLVSSSASTLMVETVSDVDEGSQLKSTAFLIQSSPTFSKTSVPALPPKECPHCGIRFSSSSTLKAHMASYCSRRPVVIEKNTTGWPTRKRFSAQSSLRTDSTANSPDLGQHPPTPVQLEMASQSSAVSVNQAGLLQQAASAAVNAAPPSPLAFCAQCGLFFASKELFEIHMRLNRQQLLDEYSLYPGALVLAAPVVTTSGIQYIPIHPKTGCSEPTAPPTTSAIFNGSHHPLSAALSVATSSVPPLPAAPLSPVKSHTSLVNGGGVDVGAVGDEVKPLDLRVPGVPGEQGGGCVSPPAGSENHQHVLRHKQQQQLGVQQEHIDSQVNQLTQLIRRPFLCSFCNTRFQSRSTYQAHQQFYCQGRQQREAKRRRVGPQLPPLPSSTANDRMVSMDATEQQQLSAGGAWEEVKEGYRCVRCGYLGQTVRGMKIHSKMHDVHRADSRSLGGDSIGPDENHENILHHRHLREIHTGRSMSTSPPETSETIASPAMVRKSSYNPSEERSVDYGSDSETGASSLPPSSAVGVPQVASTGGGAGGLVMGLPLGLKNNCKTCRSCGSHYDHLEEFVRHIKFECTASKTTLIKQEELSPV